MVILLRRSREPHDAHCSPENGFEPSTPGANETRVYTWQGTWNKERKKEKKKAEAEK
jgi:hypothetical protein